MGTFSNIRSELDFSLLMKGEDAVFPCGVCSGKETPFLTPKSAARFITSCWRWAARGITIELVPEDGLGLLQAQEDDRILGQVVPFRIGIKPAGRAVVEQGHMGFLHTDGENNQQTEVIKPHLMTEALQLLLDLAGLLALVNRSMCSQIASLNM
jgi:hypothetical protein